MEALPASLLLEVPFTSQAPFGNWDEPYQEACEEAVMLMLMHYEKFYSNWNDIPNRKKDPNE